MLIIAYPLPLTFDKRLKPDIVGMIPTLPYHRLGAYYRGPYPFKEGSSSQ